MPQEYVDTTLLDGYAGGPHITVEQVGLANQGLYGADDYVLGIGKKAAAQILTNNSIRIFDAVYVIQGRRDVINANGYKDVSIANGSQGMNRNDIIVRRYEKDESSEIEKTSYAVIKGVPAAGVATDPEVTVGDIKNGATLHEMALYRVRLNGLNIVGIDPLFKTLVNMSEIQEMITDLNSKSYEIIKSSNGYVKKYADGRFEAYSRTTIQNVFNFTQIGNSGIYYASFSNVAIGITAVEVSSIVTNAANNGVIWSGNAYLNNNNQAVNGMVFQYGLDKTRLTTMMIEVKGRWK